MRYQASLQFLLIIVAVALIYLVAKPKLAEISLIQDQQFELSEALEKTDQYNTRLAQLLQEKENISNTDIKTLDQFVPDTINITKVARDVNDIFTKNGLTILDISPEKPSRVTVSVENGGRSLSPSGVRRDDVASNSLLKEAKSSLVSQAVTVSAVGQYEQLKSLLLDLERNAYPLRVMTFSLTTEPESDVYTYDFRIETYGLSAKGLDDK